jgi:hypothetical protein
MTLLARRREVEAPPAEFLTPFLILSGLSVTIQVSCNTKFRFR